MDPSRRLLPLQRIGDLLGCSHEKVRQIIKKGLNSNHKIKNSRTRITRHHRHQNIRQEEDNQNLSDEHIRFLTAEKTLKEWVGHTLKQRCRRFEIRYPGKQLTVYRLLKVYRQAGIKRKKIRKTKIISDDKKIQIKE